MKFSMWSLSDRFLPRVRCGRVREGRIPADACMTTDDRSSFQGNDTCFINANNASGRQGDHGTDSRGTL